VFGEKLERIEEGVFDEIDRCSIRRIVIPLKVNLIICNNAFRIGASLSRVDTVPGIHKTISSLLMEPWRNEMGEEIDRINHTLPNNPAEKTRAIQQWITRVLDRMEH
jgi:hypothetical protein